MKNNKSKYSTIIITDKNSLETKIFSVKNKHIRNIFLYKKILLLSIFTIFCLVAGLVSYISYVYYQKQDLHVKIADLESKLDTKKLNDMIINLNEAEKSLLKIERYLKDRQVKTLPTSATNFNVDNVGGEYYPVNDSNLNLIENKKKRISDIYKKIQFIPIGLPHVGRITSNFGVRGNPMKKGKGSEFHPGLDIAGTIGDPIHATANGVVTFASVRGGYGNCVMIKHHFGYETLYGHMSKILVKEGQVVNAGDVIGELGSTGRSTGPHVHYEIILNKEKENPNNYLHVN
ncbi:MULTISPECIES: M23 family metallopeptidase [unclassified Apibacter]|uniref:M23 family metallopeptidase n=1 Tax=unclassified Apibacter TaxID=2630820 RepID=UPI00135E1696|nr:MULTISPECIES: M23 family metallopeptidase [unclassified Apibacter]MXP05637.1 peptidoglycan DD-metalloendopeptidase family protein [Apibacter sp. B3546]MXP13097.1 peptidoglycan DD-metalloendopeptidase family protein [Apibacter sp. B3239]